MQIRNKYYPYPVIAYGNDSYDDSEFVSDANYAHDAHNIKFQFEAVLTDNYLSAMIANGQVKYAHHIECQQTCFRTLIVTDRASYECFLLGKHTVERVCSGLSPLRRDRLWC